MIQKYSRPTTGNQKAVKGAINQLLLCDYDHAFINTNQSKSEILSDLRFQKLRSWQLLDDSRC